MQNNQKYFKIIIITNILLKTDKPTKINKGHYKCLPRILNIQAFLQKIS